LAFFEITAFREMPIGLSFPCISFKTLTKAKRGLPVNMSSWSALGCTSPCISFLQSMTLAFDRVMWETPFSPVYQQNAMSPSAAPLIEAAPLTFFALLPSD
jgi:hypothetical protein